VAEADRALLDGVDRQLVDRRVRRRSAQMFSRLTTAARIAMPVLILIATALAGEAGQRWGG
jgi:hypothetical protein